MLPTLGSRVEEAMVVAAAEVAGEDQRMLVVAVRIALPELETRVTKLEHSKRELWRVQPWWRCGGWGVKRGAGGGKHDDLPGEKRGAAETPGALKEPGRDSERNRRMVNGCASQIEFTYQVDSTHLLD